MSLWRRPTVLLLLVMLTLGLTGWVAVAKAPMPGDLWLAQRTQSVPGLNTLAAAVNWAGDLRWMPAVAFVAWWMWRARSGGWRRVAILGLVLLLLQSGSQILKGAVDSPRPSAADGIVVDRLRGDSGFPSGHVYGDVLTYGALAILAPRALPPVPTAALRVVAMAVILTAGWARVYVGAHWPSDVLGGYLWGALAVTAFEAATSVLLDSRRGAAGARMSPDPPRAIDESIDREADVRIQPSPSVEDSEA